VGPAATIIVTNGTSTVATGDGCSLPEAMINANADDQSGSTDCAAGNGADIIDLQTNVTLTAVNNTTSGNNGLPVVSSAITIEGNDHTISRQAGSPDFRIMFVGSGGNLTLNSATISGGIASGSAPANRGGAINISGAQLTVTNSTLSGNSSSSYGGALEARYSTVTVSNSTISDNVATVLGGGIFARQSSGTVTDSVLSGNSAQSGGGIGVLSSTITVSGSTLSGNSSTWGGGIDVSSASLAISNSVLSGNSASTSGGTGGGVNAKNSTVTVLNSTLTGNLATRGGGIYARTASLAISNSALSGNRGGAFGGAIYVGNSPTVMVSNSTISGNSTNNGGSGGGIGVRFSTVTVSNSTISGNWATFGGGIKKDGGEVTVLSSIVALQNSGTDCNPGVTTGGYNIESGSSCGFTGTGDFQNVSSANLALNALADNGGPTQTMALGFGSVALDHIPTSLLEANGCGVTVTTDQRGLPRAGGTGAGGPACDVGAYEAQTPPLAVTLASFDAQPMVDHILLSWETVSEVNNAGFNLYRSDSPAAPDELLAFVPSQAPGSTQGTSYSFDDTQVAAGQTWYYWLEDVNLNGATTLHGPVSAALQAPTAVRLDALETQAAAPGATPWGALVAAMIAAAGVLRVRRRSCAR
ncbi:MAG: right-handed parallel beta-helix repeat-containing protein, partial [Caldilineales bacterium]